MLSSNDNPRPWKKDVTKGEWKFYTEPQPNGCPIIGTIRGLMVAQIAHSTKDPSQKDEAIANAHLLTEAGTVLHQTGMTPGELAERVEELTRALRVCKGIIYNCGYSLTRDEARAVYNKVEESVICPTC
jgi:hypothetical protein